jgi:hypothetical protein
MATIESGKLGSRVAVDAPVERSIAELRERTPEDRAALVVFCGDLDRVLAAFGQPASYK